MSAGLKPLLKPLAAGARLNASEMTAAMDAILDGAASETEIAGFLMAIAARSPSPEEITAAARALRARARTIAAPADCVDTCGTGGDGGATFNISTAAALIAAGAGVRIAKHGNRAVSSKSGSSDVLSALGVNINAPLERVERAIAEVGVGFLFAPNHHPAVKHAAAARQALGVRTLFNIIGPLANPAGAKRQVLGVYSADLLTPVAEALRELGSERALVVHGSDGLDEITLTGSTSIAELKTDGSIERYEVSPDIFGIGCCNINDLEGGGPIENAHIVRAILTGELGPRRDVAVLNAAAAIWMSGLSPDLKNGTQIAVNAIDSGASISKLEALAEATRDA